MRRGEVPIDFSWRAFPTVEEEIAQKLKLQVQLKQEETEEQLFYQQVLALGSSTSGFVFLDVILELIRFLGLTGTWSGRMRGSRGDAALQVHVEEDGDALPVDGTLYRLACARPLRQSAPRISPLRA